MTVMVTLPQLLSFVQFFYVQQRPGKIVLVAPSVGNIDSGVKLAPDITRKLLHSFT